MKKLAVVLFLAVALVVPVLAEKPNMELIPKIGYLFSPEMKYEDINDTFSDESAISFGAELFFNMRNNFFLGGGFMWGDIHKLNSKSDDKVGFSNLYAAAKYKILVNGTEENPFFLYPLAQLGVGFGRCEVKDSNTEIDGGLYWGLGAGVEIANIVAEFIYGCNYGEAKAGHLSVDLTYTAFRINVGYKFEL